jgi:uncharacterized Tic20 family protein
MSIRLPIAWYSGPSTDAAGLASRSAVGLLLRAIMLRDIRSLVGGIGSAGTAATVACFQFAVFTSFLSAASAAPRWLAADVWVSDRGVESFDFPMPISEGYAGAVLAELPGAAVRRVVFGFTGWVSPAGRRGNVALIGVEATGLAPRRFVADRSDMARLDIVRSESESSIGALTMASARPTDGLATFLGAPYVIAGLDDARAALAAPIDQVAFLAIDFPRGRPSDLDARLRRLKARYPELDVRTDEAFQADSSRYWQAKTGAGAAILLAAVLASLLMVLLMLNSIGRFIQRRSQDFVSLIGHGASDRQLTALVAAVAAVLTGGAGAVALVAVPLARAVAAPMLPWVTLKPVDIVFALALVAISFGLAVFAAIRALKRFPPHVIFRS